MEAFPHMQTIESFIENSAGKYPQSHILDFHNKATGHERRIATYLAENVRIATDLEVGQSHTQLHNQHPFNETDIHLPNPIRPIRSHDLRIPQLAPPMGR